MTASRPLFSSNIARSGSGMLRMMMSTNSQVMLASEPFLELYRSFRNAIIRERGRKELHYAFPPNSPIQDYYFSDLRIELMDLIQESTLSLPFRSEEWPEFIERCSARTALDSADLVPYLPEVRAETYKGIFDRALGVIAQARRAEMRKWIGAGDSWTIEFLRPLARSYLDARFIIIIRDPRAIINSNLGEARKNPEWVAQPLSFLRHWRKLVSFTVNYQNDPLFRGRLFVIRHEDILANAEAKAHELCSFLEIPFEPAMLDTERYFDFATGSTWTGNSAFEGRTAGILAHRAERWRDMLDPRIRKMIEFMCYPELKLAGYEVDSIPGFPDDGILEYLLESQKSNVSWRSDLGDPQSDYGFELFRWSLLCTDVEDIRLVRRAFLFEDTYHVLRSLDGTFHLLS